MSKKRIVIAGGGIAGLELITRLSKRVDKSYELYLIDKAPIHTWKPMLHMFATGSTTPEQQGISFIKHAKRHNFQFIPGEINHIDRKQKKVVLAPLITPAGNHLFEERTIDYDYLILTVGSCANDFGTDGVLDYAYTIDDLTRADHLLDRFNAAIITGAIKQEERNIVIVGAGASGVELAGEMVKVLETASSYADYSLNENFNITIVQGDQRILPAFPESISQNTQASLEKLGVRVLLEKKVVKVTADNVTLDDGRVLPADITVWTGGVKAHDFMNNIDGVSLSRSGQLIVNPMFQSLEDETLFAIGDSSSIDQNPLPPTAQVARQQAIYLGKYLIDMIEGRKPSESFDFMDAGSLVSVGRYASFGTFGSAKLKRISIKGVLASIAHTSLYRMHQVATLGFWRAFCTWFSEQLTKLAGR